MDDVQNHDIAKDDPVAHRPRSVPDTPDDGPPESEMEDLFAVRRAEERTPRKAVLSKLAVKYPPPQSWYDETEMLF